MASIPAGPKRALPGSKGSAREQGRSYAPSDEHRLEIDREFLQFYQRRICCLALRRFAAAVADADHTLALIDFVAAHSSDPQWTASHKQYRPFVLFHRIQAATMMALEDSGPEVAIETINRGIQQLQEVFSNIGADEEFGREELVSQLTAMQASLREEYRVGKTLGEQLADAVASEEYERAARFATRLPAAGMSRA